ncbi:MAG: hypothetical protein FD123_4037 [Bacteroidetes bacterium]|nr:MAG: hypothetical protein FD123_4037 [Bacteroidota bacterium]
MKNICFTLLLFCGVSFAASAQKDTTCTTILKVMDLLREKENRGQVKGAPVQVTQGSMGKVTSYKSKIEIPGMKDAVLVEGLSRVFKAYVDAATYEQAVKEIQSFNAKMHQCFDGGWTFTETNESKELYSSYKIARDKDMLSSSAVKYYLERNGTGFRLVLEIGY